MITIKGNNNQAKVFTDNADSATLSQVREICNQEYVKGCIIRIMPDCHAGAGCVIGTTMTIGDYVVPNLVGVDIGCGVRVVEIPANVDLKVLDEYIHREIPSGFLNNKTAKAQFPKMGEILCMNEIRGGDYNLALGSLGGGNHFIEVDKDDEGVHYLVIHSGSRNLGKQVAELYQKKAQVQCEADGIHLHKDLCYLKGKLKKDYLHDMNLVQQYAALNRETMARRIVKQCLRLDYDTLDTFESVHNYIDVSENVLRKGAISAKNKEAVVIPINMRDGSLIAVGKGNSDWNNSAPHGAGRIMGRNEAKKKFFIDEFRKSMEGIYTTCVNVNTIDESPMVYKPMDEIMMNIQDTVEIQKVIKPIYNFKAGEEISEVK